MWPLVVMKDEIAAAVFFVARLVKRHGCLDNEGRDRFAAALTSALFESYKNHWYPHTPTKGQAYRSVDTHTHTHQVKCHPETKIRSKCQCMDVHIHQWEYVLI